MSTTRTHRRRTLAIAGFIAAALAVAGCTDESRYAAPTTTTPELRTAPIAALVSYDRCEDHLAWLKAEAMERVTAWGIDGVVSLRSYRAEMYTTAGGMDEDASAMDDSAGARENASAADAAAPPT